jgi:catechol 2,3-dioxygenase-like lactoylglutathione lyase family enzyme
MAFAIPAAEFESWEQHLSSKGIAIERKKEWELGGRSLYFRDPDNHSLEVVTPGCWPNY